MAREEAVVAAALAEKGRFSVRVIAAALGVSRSNPIERRRRQYFVRRCRHLDDRAVTDRIQQVDARPTCGYLRTARLVSRNVVAGGGTPVNAKRVYRIMKAQGGCSRATRAIHPHPRRRHHHDALEAAVVLGRA